MTAADATAGGRFWCRIEHDFARDSAFLEVADRCGTTPPTVQSVALQLRTAENAGKKLGPADLESIAWFCRVPAELVRRIVETLVKLGRLARSVLVAITRRSNTDQQRARHLAAQQRFLARKRQDRRQLSLFLPINARSTPIKSDQTPSTAPANPLPAHEPRPPDPRSNADQTPSTAPQKEERSKEETLEILKKEERGSGRASALSAANAAVQAEHRAKRLNSIKTLRRWVRYSGRLDQQEQLHRLLMLDRAETAAGDIAAWLARPIEDRQCFDYLKYAADRAPLAREWLLACEQQERQDARAKMLAGWGKSATGLSADGRAA